MDDENKSLLAEAIVAIKEGNLEKGRQHLDDLLQQEPDNLSAWLWMSAAVTSNDERQRCLQEVLRINPNHAQALRGLEKLSPQPEPEAEATVEREAEIATEAEAETGAEAMPEAEIKWEPLSEAQEEDKLELQDAAEVETEDELEPQDAAEVETEDELELQDVVEVETEDELEPSEEVAEQEEEAIFPWMLEAEQADQEPEGPLGNVDLDEYLDSFPTTSRAKEKQPVQQAPTAEEQEPDTELGERSGSEAEGSEAASIEWHFDQSDTDSKDSTEGMYATERLSGEEALERFLGMEPKRRTQPEQPEEAQEPVPAFVFDEPSDEAAALAVATGEETEAEFTFDIDQITEPLPEDEAGSQATDQELPLLWANPGGSPNSLCILRGEYLVLAHPDPLFLDRIRDEALQGQVKKKSIGRTARDIHLKAMLSLTCEPDGSSFEVTYKKGKQRLQERAEFFSTAERDEAVEAIAGRLGPNFTAQELSTTRLRTILAPLVLMVLALLITPLVILLMINLLGGWATLAGVSLWFLGGIALAGLLLFLIGLLWLSDRRKLPLRQVVIERLPEIK